MAGNGMSPGKTGTLPGKIKSKPSLFPRHCLAPGAQYGKNKVTITFAKHAVFLG
jgi:hypothetical protein